MRVTWEWVKPAQAETYINTNPTYQRQVQPALVARYAEWQLNETWVDWVPDALLFDEQGKLINGQHRLLAVMLTGRTCGFWVIRGCTRERQFIIDQGRNRSVADLLQTHTGIHTSAHTGAVLRVVLSGYEGVFHSVRGGTAHTGAHMKELYEQVKPQLDTVHKWLREEPRTPAVRTAVTEGIIVRALVAHPSEERRIRLFLHILCTGDCQPMPCDRAGILCREVLMDTAREESKQFSGRGARRRKYAYVQTALRAFLDERHVSDIVPATRELFPLSFDAPGHPMPVRGGAVPLVARTLPGRAVADGIKVARSPLYTYVPHAGGGRPEAGLTDPLSSTRH